MQLSNAARSKTLLTVLPALAAMSLAGFFAPAQAKPQPHGVLPPQLCLAVYPAPLQPALCGQGDGGKPSV
jgi:hypothetical protein